MQEAAKIYYKIVPKDDQITMQQIIDQSFKNKSSIIRHNYCSNENHVPAYMDAILNKRPDFDNENLIIITIGYGRINQQMQDLKNKINLFHKPRKMTWFKFKLFKNRLFIYYLNQNFDFKTKKELAEKSGFSNSFVYKAILEIEAIINSTDPDDENFQSMIKEF